MNTTQDDGGPAFPYANPDYDGNWNTDKMIPGMSLRDYFAGMALQGTLSIRDTHTSINHGVIHQDDVAGSCYEWADAMLAARKEAR